MRMHTGASKRKLRGCRNGDLVSFNHIYVMMLKCTISHTVIL